MANHSKSAEARHPGRKEKRHSELASVESPDKVLARNLHCAAEREELRKRSTLGLYSMRMPESKDVTGSFFGVPYCALTDALAVTAQKQVLPQANVYKVGTICLYDGKVVPCRPTLILDNKVL